MVCWQAVTGLLEPRKTLAPPVDDGVGHALPNDTGANSNPAAARDAVSRAIGWFNKSAREPAAA